MRLLHACTAPHSSVVDRFWSKNTVSVSRPRKVSSYLSPRTHLDLRRRYSYVLRGAVESLDMARAAGTDPPRRRLTPAPCRVHAGDLCACTRPAAGWIAQRAGSVPRSQDVRRSSAPPTNVCKTRSSCSDLLSLLALLAVAVQSTSSRSTVSGSDSFMEYCGCAKAHQRRCGTASVLAVVRDGRASAARTCQ